MSYFKRLCLLCSDAAVMDRQRRGVTTVIVMERSFFSNRWVFTELAQERGYLTRVDYEHLCFFFDVCVNRWKHFPRMDAIFLLQAPVAEVNDGKVEKAYFLFDACFMTSVGCECNNAHVRLKPAKTRSLIATISLLSTNNTLIGFNHCPMVQVGPSKWWRKQVALLVFVIV